MKGTEYVSKLRRLSVEYLASAKAHWEDDRDEIILFTGYAASV